MDNFSKAILFYNTKAGNIKMVKDPQIILDYFKDHNIDLQMIEIPISAEEIDNIISEALLNRIDMVVAAGGDGTASLVSNKIVGTEVPLAIIPLGTGNLLAKQLNIPLKLEKALELIVAPDHEIVEIDTINFNDRNYLMNLSVGISPKIMETTPSSEKQRLGVFSYIIHFIHHLLGLQLQRVTLEFDHQMSTHLASEVLITNIGIAGIDPLIWSEDVLLNDNVLDLLIFRAHNFSDFVRLLISIFTKKGKKSPEIKFHKIREYCRIESHSPMRIQADGDVIGTTPAEIFVKPSSLKIIAGKSIDKHDT